jgi:hypothetical protein
MTHTYAYLDIGREAFREISNLLRDAGYAQAFHYDGERQTIVIDMDGIALRCIEPLDSIALAAEEET